MEAAMKIRQRGWIRLSSKGFSVYIKETMEAEETCLKRARTGILRQRRDMVERCSF
jgi:hypothetical protein